MRVDRVNSFSEYFATNVFEEYASSPGVRVTYAQPDNTWCVNLVPEPVYQPSNSYPTAGSTGATSVNVSTLLRIFIEVS